MDELINYKEIKSHEYKVKWMVSRVKNKKIKNIKCQRKSILN